MKSGDEFNLFARRWRVVGMEARSRSARAQSSSDAERGLLCRQVASDNH